MLLLPVLAVSFLPGPVLLGNWESLTFYHTFGAVDAPLSFLIAPRANIGGQGYALLEIARAVILAFDLPLNLRAFRIPSVAFSIVSLVLFFIIGRRYFGPWPAIGATALLAGNQVFFQTGQMMTVLVVSGAALLFMMERLQALEVRYWDLKAWMGAGLAMALVALHYGLVRIFAALLIGLWFAKAFWILRKTPGSAAVMRSILLMAGYSAATLLVVLTLLDYRNLISIAQIQSFFFPQHSEIAVLQYSPGAEGVASVFRMMEINLRVMLESMSGMTGNFHSRHSSYVFADYRYPILDGFVVPFVVLGAAVAAARLTRRTVLFATPWGNVLAMLAVFALPVLFSLVLIRDDRPFGTISVNRLYFCLFPLHLLVAAFLHWLGASSLPRIAKYAAAIGVTAVFAGQVAGLSGEHARFKAQVFAAEWQKHGPESWPAWDDGAPNLDRRERYFASHLQQHAQYANAAKQLAFRLRAKDVGGGGPAVRRIVFVDANKFSEAPAAPAQLHYIANRNFHSIFLALYAGQEGVNVNPVVMVHPERKPINPELMSGIGYRGKPREYSALMELARDGRLAYRSGMALVPVVVRVTGKSTYDILVTTPEEEAGARNLLKQEKVPFEYVRI